MCGAGEHWKEKALPSVKKAGLCRARRGSARDTPPRCVYRDQNFARMPAPAV
ncbi:hypothetical protein SAMN05446935_1421 [Burkholderia sp. YR290]|nr:hypothetical protein SAMN05445504_0654 [Burkholderia sp. CF099]SOE58880.1 hypothetical protein SAMN05446935_1421 [Burkholderia sp. YR290]